MNTTLALSYDLSPIDKSNLADTTKVQYKKALQNYLATGNKLGDISSLEEYARGLKNSSRAFLKSAIRLMGIEQIHNLKSSATPDNLPEVQASLYRLEALNDAIQVQTSKGEKAHIWLSPQQTHQIMQTCDDSISGKRDWIVLGLLLGAGIRREEIVNLRFEDLIDLPMSNNGIRTCLQVKGKGSKFRVIPVSKVLAQRIQEWHKIVGDNGLICRSLGRKQEIGNSISAIGIFNIVRKHGKMIGINNLDPHDCRRTFAQLGYESGVPITQISKQLGHNSIVTSQRYLNLDLNLLTTVSDFIPLE